ncbi:hypothetical protein KAR91_19020 [Candidatus Pacearchaeota archaeon]|nr:hypothetical protein [Candidatus Pacearchaeota archaeon]
MKWFGYILFENSEAISDPVKDSIAALSCGDNNHCSKYAPQLSLDGTKMLVRISIDKKGEELTAALDLIDIDSYKPFGKLSYEKNEIKGRVKSSWYSASKYFQENIDLFELPRSEE